MYYQNSVSMGISLTFVLGVILYAASLLPELSLWLKSPALWLLTFHRSFRIVPSALTSPSAQVDSKTNYHSQTHIGA